MELVVVCLFVCFCSFLFLSFFCIVLFAAVEFDSFGVCFCFGFWNYCYCLSFLYVYIYSQSLRFLTCLDAAINSGNSGGPALIEGTNNNSQARHEVAGIAFQCLSGADNIGTHVIGELVGGLFGGWLMGCWLVG
jgi:hypothetical protein